MDLSIICVNWNSADYLLSCLSSVAQYTHGIEYEVIVVDNASSPQDIEKLSRAAATMRLILSPENIGFAQANNAGFQASTGAYVLLLNPDTELIGPAITTMLEKIRTLPDAGIVGCKLLNTDRTVQLSSIQKSPTILNQVFDAEYLLLRWPNCPLWRLGPLFSDQTEPVSVDAISGACMLMKREVFEQVGMFSQDYFMYAEDLDLNYKVKRTGRSNYYVGAATMIHHGGKSSGRQGLSHWATIMKYTAMLRYYRNTRGRLYELLYRAAMGCAAAGRVIALSILYPFADRTALRGALKKWVTILGWAVGRHTAAAQGR